MFAYFKWRFDIKQLFWKQIFACLIVHMNFCSHKRELCWSSSFRLWNNDSLKNEIEKSRLYCCFINYAPFVFFFFWKHFFPKVIKKYFSQAESIRNLLITQKANENVVFDSLHSSKDYFNVTFLVLKHVFIHNEPR